MYIYAQAASGRLAFQERHMCMCFGVFFGNAEVEYMRIQHKAFFGYFKILYLVVLFSIQNMLAVGSQPLAQMYIIAIAAEAFAAVRLYYYSSFLNFLQYAG